MADIIGTPSDDVLNGTPGGGADTFVGGAGNDTMTANGGGDDTVDYVRETGLLGVIVNQHVSNSVTLSDGRVLGPDSAFDTFGDLDSIVGIRHVIGSNFADEIYGGAHANRIMGGGGDDYIHGKGERDTAVYRGSASEYNITLAADGTVTVTDLVADRDGTDTLVSVEDIDFLGASLPPSATPAIVAVQTPNQPAKIGSVVPVHIWMTAYDGVLSLAADSTVGGYPLANLVKLSDSHYRAEFTVTASADLAANADLAVNLKLLNASLQETAPYVVPIRHDEDAIDATLPTVTSISVDQNVITLIFSEVLGLDHPGESGFAVSRNGLPYGTAGIGFGTDGKTVYLNMDRAALTGDVVTVSYVGPSAGFGSLQDTAGNHVAVFTNRPVVNQTLPSFWISAVESAASEGDSGTSAYKFTVMRSGDAAIAGSVQYAVAGSATEAALGYTVVAADAADFGGSLPGGTLNFAIGQTSQVITVLVSGDAAVEPDEYFTVTLSNPVGGVLQPQQGHIAGAFIINDDSPSSPTVPPPPFVPPTVSDPSPGDAFNEAQAAASVATFFTGESMGPEKLEALSAFSTLHYEAYIAAGVARPELGPYEALGRAFAETPDFAAKYGAQTEANFIAAAYAEVFGRPPSPIQQAHFQAQIDYFELIYENAGISSEQADLFAKGAALGQMIGHATLDVSSSSVQLLTAVALTPGDLI